MLTSVQQLDSSTFQKILNFPRPLRLVDYLVEETTTPFPNGMKAALESHIIYKKVTQEELDKEGLETLKKDFVAKAKVDPSKVETLEVELLGDSTTSTTTKTIH